MKKEFKTLRDFEDMKYPQWMIKQEAIKRVNNCPYVFGLNLLCQNIIQKYKCCGCQRDIWFNNITEENLK